MTPITNPLQSLILMIVVATASAGSSPKQNPQIPAEAPIELPAFIEPYERVELHARVSGYVVDVSADLGDKVKAGQVLVRIERPELVADLAAARAETKQRASLVTRAKRAASQADAALLSARAQVARAQADTSLQEITLRRKVDLLKESAITEQAMDEAKAANASALASSDLAAAAVARAEADRAAALAEIEVALAQEEVARSRERCVEATIALLEVRSPFEGIITMRRCSRGDLTSAAASAGQPGLFTLLRTDPVRVQVDVPELVASRIRIGTQATISAAPDQPAIDARVTRTSGALDVKAHTLRVEIDLNNPNDAWLCGSFVRVQLKPEPLLRRGK